jgi:hypothetical protein
MKNKSISLISIVMFLCLVSSGFATYGTYYPVAEYSFETYSYTNSSFGIIYDSIGRTNLNFTQNTSAGGRNFSINQGYLGKGFNTTWVSTVSNKTVDANFINSTICGWVKKTGIFYKDTNIYSVDVGGRSAGIMQDYLVDEYNKTSFYYGGFSSTQISNAVADLNWHYYCQVIIFSDNKYNYLDGVAHSTAGTTYSGTGLFTFRSFLSSTSLMDEITVFNYSLTLTNISDIYNKYLAGYRPNDLVAPSISSITSSVTNQTAIIKWSTDMNSNTSVNYGTTVSLGTTVSTSNNVTSHSQTLSSLSPNTDYFYSVTSCSDSGCTTSDIYSLRTLASGSFYIYSPTNSILDNITTIYPRVNLTNIWDWRLNGKSIALLNLPFESATSSKTLTKDYSSYQNNGTVSGATWCSDCGVDGKGAYVFSGGDQKINTTTTTSNGQNITWGSWIKLNTNFLDWGYLGKSNSTITATQDHDFEIGAYAGNNMTFCSILNTSKVKQTTSISYEMRLGEWYQVYCVLNGNNLSKYVNGVQIDSTIINGQMINRNLPLVIGKTSAGSPNGTIDNVQVYNRSLSSQEILNLYNSVNRTYSQLANATILSMPFDAQTSNTTFTPDVSGNNKNGVVSGATFNATDGYDGKGAYQFNSSITTSQINTNINNNYNDSFTISAWVKPLSCTDTLIGGFGDQAHVYPLNMKCSNDKFMTLAYDGTNAPAASYTIPIYNTWYYVVGVRDKNIGNVSLYINGNLYNTINDTTKFNSVINATQNFIIGGRSVPNYVFNGSIDNVKIFNKALTQAEITQLYNQQKDPYETNIGSPLLPKEELAIGDSWNLSYTTTNAVDVTQYSNTITIGAVTTVLSMSPANATQSTSQVTFNVTSFNMFNDTSAKLYLDGSVVTSATQTEGQHTISSTTSTEGNHSFYAAYNISGTIITSSTYEFYIDTTSPTITTNITQNSLFYTNNLTGRINITDSKNIYSVNISIDGTEINYSTPQTTSYELNLSTDINWLTSGQHNLTIVAYNGKYSGLTATTERISIYKINATAIYSASIIETSLQTIYLNITGTNQTAYASLNYNGTFQNISLQYFNYFNSTFITPITSHSTVPISWNFTIGTLTGTVSFTQTISDIIISNCTGEANISIGNISTYDETNENLIPTNTTGIFRLYGYNKNQYVQYNLSWRNLNTQPICIKNTSQTIFMDYQIESVGGNNLLSRLNGFNQTISTSSFFSKKLYLPNISYTNTITPSVIDGRSNPIQGYVLELNKYSATTGTILALRSELLGSAGNSIFYYEPTTQYAYKIYDRSGNLVFDDTSDYGLMTANTVTLKVLSLAPDYITKELNVWNLRTILYNVSSQIYLNWTTLTGSGVICLNVTRYNSSSHKLLNSECSVSSSGYLTYNVTESSGTINAIAYIKGSTYVTNLLTFALTPITHLYDELGIDSLLIYIIFIIVAIAISLTKISTMPYFLAIVHLASWWLGIIPGTYAIGVIAMMVALILIMLRVKD